MALKHSEIPARTRGLMADAAYEFDGFRLDAVRRQLRHPDGQLLDMPARAFDTLLFLIEQRSQIVPKDQLMQAVWPQAVVEENTLSQAISALRRALGDESAAPRFVMTVAGRGYRFIAPVRETSESARVPMPSAASGPRSVAARLDSVAVLPFKSLLPGQANPALELGMADTLISELSTLRNLRVSPLGTVRRYATLDQDPIRAGAELGVAAVLEGSIQTQGERLRVTARLLRIDDGHALWAGRFDESVSDVFAIQDSIAVRVITALRPALDDRVPALAPTRQTRNLSAYQFYIAGLFNQLRRDIDGLPESVRNYQAATAADPTYVRAWAGLSVSLAVQGVFGTQPPMAVFPRAKEAALHAIALDPSSPEALGAFGHILVQYERKYEEGYQHYVRAREIDGNNAHLRLWIAINLGCRGHLDLAVAEIHRAIEIEPKTLAFSAVLGTLLYFQRSFDEAIRHLQQMVDLEPQFDQARTFLGKAWLQKGDPDRALQHFTARVHTAPGSFSDLACAYAQAGRVSEARREIAKLRKLGDDGYGVAYDLATVHAALDEIPEACRELERALHDHSQMIGFLRADPALDKLRNEPGYADVSRRLYGP
jgi:DNA-binding winged helix-turn-helix (wHTH) protein/tetratricopeptide (TPR) repeat protein